jgi:hypothetical protein
MTYAKPQLSIEQRVARAAEAALADHKYVSAIDVLTGIGLLASTNVEAWRKGRIDFLETMIQGSSKKISAAMSAFRSWAEMNGLVPTETSYVARTRTGIRNLQVTQSGDPAVEKFYRTHYVSPDLSERKRKNLEERLAKPAQPVVFQNIRDSQCSECGVELPSEGFLAMEAGQPLCLACAKFSNLEFLPAGDTALTRRASKYSGNTAVVVRFSRTRKRYERQGILVETAALHRAEQECAEDAEERAAARASAVEVRRAQDADLIARMTERLLVLFARCSPAEANAIAKHTAARGSGRVGRTAAGRELEEGALTAAVAAAIRHNHTEYDALLAAGLERGLARERVAERVRAILAAWRE